MASLRRHPTLVVVATAILVALVVASVGVAVALQHMRNDIAGTAAALSRTTGELNDLPAQLTPADLTATLDAAGVPARYTGVRGQDLGRSAVTPEIWDEDGGAGFLAGLATTGVRVSIVGDAVEVARPLGEGRAVVTRQWLPTSATGISAAGWGLILGSAAIAGLLAGLAVWTAQRMRRREVAAITGAAESLIAGKMPRLDPLVTGGDLARAGDAIAMGAERIGHLTEIADRELSMLNAAVEPLPIGVAGRGPAGGRLRNLVLERMIDSLEGIDRTEVEDAIRVGLESDDPVGGKVRLRDGRVLEIDAWSVPGGRLVSVMERTEQERLEAFRRQIQSAAVRQLKAPLDEMKTRGKELYQYVPAPAAPSLRSLLGATDRLDRVVRMMLRGTSHDPASRAPRAERLGIAGFLWALAHDWDAALRQRALRVELDVATDLPDVRTDPALVEEILTELIDNAAKYTPRGGTIQLSARGMGDELMLDVRDSGPGISDEDAPLATERFFRGTSSESIPGAGLELGVAAALAERIGGRLEVLPGPGGRVRLFVPVERDRPALIAV